MNPRGDDAAAKTLARDPVTLGPMGAAFAETTPPPRREPANTFDFIRFAMAILVIYSHAYPLSQPDNPDPIARLTLGQVGAGEVAVYVFFVISGYLVAASRERSGAASFLKRRVLRIYPAFIVAIAVSAFLITPIALESHSAYWTWRLFTYWLTTALTLDGWAAAGAFSSNPFPTVVNGSLWTIRYEFACYLLILAIGRGPWSTRVLVGLMIAALIVNAAGCLGWMPTESVWIGFLFIAVRSAIISAALFLVGAASWRFRERVRYTLWVAFGCVIALMIASRFPSIRAFDLIAPLALSYLALSGGLTRTPDLKDFARRVGGDYSYGIYLYAFPIQQLVTMACGGTMTPLMNFAISAPLAIVAGVVSWHTIEKHFVSRRRLRQN